MEHGARNKTSVVSFALASRSLLLAPRSVLSAFLYIVQTTSLRIPGLPLVSSAGGS